MKVANTVWVILVSIIVLSACGGGNEEEPKPEDNGSGGSETDTGSDSATRCRPGIVSGFAGRFDDQPILVRFAEEGQGGGPGGEGDGAPGIGAGGSLGQFFDVDVTVDFSTGEKFGPVGVDRQKGMVTIVPCDLQPPALVTITGPASSPARYYDEATKNTTSFSGRTLRSVIRSFDRNVGVTPFTEAMVRRTESLDQETANARAPLKNVETKAQGWADTVKLNQAHDEILTVVNDQLPGVFRLDELTRLPVILNEDNDREDSGVLANNPNGIYGAVIAGFVKSSSSESIASSTSPAYRKTQQFAADMSDGRLDQLQFGQPIATSSAEVTYNLDLLWSENAVETGRTTDDSGDNALRARGTILSNSTSASINGSRSFFHNDKGTLSIIDNEVDSGNLNGIQGKNESWNIGKFRQISAIPSVGFVGVQSVPGAIAALGLDGEQISIFSKTQERTPVGTPPIPLSVLRSPVPGTRFADLRGGMIGLSNGTFWVPQHVLFQERETNFNLIQVQVPAEVVRGEVGYFSFYAFEERTIGLPLGYGLTAQGNVVSWNLRDASRRRTITTPAPVVQISTDGIHVIARTNDDRVFWINPEHAQEFDFDQKPDGTFVGLVPTYPSETAGPFAINLPEPVCWAAAPYLLTCEGRALLLDYVTNGSPGNTILGYGMNLSPIQTRVPIQQKLWRATQEVIFGQGRFSFERFEPLLIAIDGSIFRGSGEPIEIPEFALQ